MSDIVCVFVIVNTIAMSVQPISSYKSVRLRLNLSAALRQTPSIEIETQQMDAVNTVT